MTGLLDLDLLTTELKNHASLSKSLAIHAQNIRKFSVKILWHDEFEPPMLPWNVPAKKEWCVIFSQLFDYLRGNGLLVTLNQTAQTSKVLPLIEPALSGSYSIPQKSLWENLLCQTLRNSAVCEVGLAIATWDRFQPDRPAPTKIRITNADTIGISFDDIRILRNHDDWQGFIQAYFRPDMSAYKVAVLGGDRARVERAGRRLQDGYVLGRFRYLPPSYEQNRTKRDTLEIVEQMDLVVLCANRIKHVDSDQLKGATVRVIPINNDSEDEIVRCTVAHFLGIQQGL